MAGMEPQKTAKEFSVESHPISLVRDDSLVSTVRIVARIDDGEVGAGGGGIAAAAGAAEEIAVRTGAAGAAALGSLHL